MSAARAIVSSRLPASGFSQNVGMPRPIDARISSAWAPVAAAMTTASAASRAASMDGATVAPTSLRDLGGAGRVDVGDEERRRCPGSR